MQTTAKTTTKRSTPTTAAAKKTIPSTSKVTTAGSTPAKSDAATELAALFVAQLKDIYWAEKALTKALPKMAKNATSKVLQDALQSHLAETNNQIGRLEKVFQMMGKKAQAQTCDAMEGLLKEADGILEETTPGPVRDAGIIASCQKVEHYEIATYGTLCAHAKTLGHDDIAKVLHETLMEEKNADTALTDTAYNDINFKAV
jgi:ferritin-like metal-binding protein YciE